ncbi:hypothetical protein BA896_006520 [Janthinobacterium lividum]|uniref:Uncharacterized protein n=1 Tax=Janthinobacterium lividum TaxID=29581 RepID=A0A1E8PSG2_9BURK|nr:hypothetical protein BA896_006520 [Janthinobacterium lividum]
MKQVNRGGILAIDEAKLKGVLKIDFSPMMIAGFTSLGRSKHLTHDAARLYSIEDQLGANGKALVTAAMTLPSPL